MKPAVFLDRDGVLNRSDVFNGRPYAPINIDRFEILPGAAAAVMALKQCGFIVIVVTNQPDVSTGAQTLENVEKMHRKLREQVDIDDIKVCYCTDADQCHRRKPAPGMLEEAATQYGIFLPYSFMVGDRWRDIEAGQAAQCTTIFIDNGYEEKPPNVCDYRTYSLTDAVNFIIKVGGQRRGDDIRVE